jgi:hypothetical protein
MRAADNLDAFFSGKYASESRRLTLQLMPKMRCSADWKCRTRAASAWSASRRTQASRISTCSRSVRSASGAVIRRSSLIRMR